MTKKIDEDALILTRFRQEHGYELMPWCEQYWGDICGIKKVTKFSKFDPPFNQLPLFWNFKLDPKEIGVIEKWYLLSGKEFRKKSLPSHSGQKIL
jgi:hypothetical protein